MLQLIHLKIVRRCAESQPAAERADLRPMQQCVDTSRVQQSVEIYKLNSIEIQERNPRNPCTGKRFSDDRAHAAGTHDADT
jgi:hypothetical protein